MPTGRKHSILIVDADQTTRVLVKSCIEGTEFTYWEVGNARDALEFAKRVQDIAIDFLVVDALMPPFNGPDLARKVLQHRPALKTLFLSGRALDDDSVKDIPFCDFLHDPLDKADLLDKLRGLVHAGEQSFSLGRAIGMED